MALFKKNIWTLFVILVLGSVFILALFTYFRWASIQQNYLLQQRSLVQLVTHATHSLFVNQEMVLDILGNELIKDQRLESPIHSRQILDDLLALNPDIVGFGLATPDGQLKVVSANLDPSKLPNLKDQPASRDSFLYALHQDKMVLGRTYFMPALNEWVIPIRKAIRNPHTGEVIAVMTAGLRLKGAAQFFNGELHIGKYNQVLLIRDRDRHIQFKSAHEQNTQAVYATPIDQRLFERAIEQVTQQSGVTLEAVKEGNETYHFWLARESGEQTLSVARFDPRFELWVVSDVQKTQMVDELVISFISYASVFAVGQWILFLLFRAIDRDETGRRKALIHQAQHDLLTGLPNRSYLLAHIADWIHRQGQSFHLLYIDMDHFKSVNDNFGHYFGDEVLKQLSQRLRQMQPDAGLLVRQGGDEFIVLVPQLNNESVQQLAKSIISTLSQPYHVKGFDFTLGASIGIAQYPQHGESLDALLSAADIAMYEAKKHRNSLRLYAKTMHDQYTQKIKIEQQLRGAIERQELSMVYQPQVDRNGELFGVEALVRWHNPELGFVPPDQFIGVAESCGLMPQLGLFILDTALAEIGQLQTALNRSFHLAVNVSIRQFMQANFIEQIQAAMQGSQVSHTLLSLEITENLFIEDLDYILPLLQQIHGMGLSISMDDFGTGYSSLSMLRTLPIDELKIDKSFVDSLLHSDSDKKLVQNIIAIGKNYNMAVLAEGVETAEQAAVLAEMSCDRFQGYHYAKPMPIDQLRAHIVAQYSDQCV